MTTTNNNHNSFTKSTRMSAAIVGVTIGVLFKDAWKQTKRRMRQRIAHGVASIVRWAFTLEGVQDAFVETATCGSPIGRVLNETINQALNNQQITVNADDVEGLNQYISDELESFMGDNSVKACNIDGLDDEVEQIVTSEGFTHDLAQSVVAQIGNSPETMEELVAAVTEKVLEEMINRLRG